MATRVIQLTVEQAQALLNYLIEQPYREVVQLTAMLASAPSFDIGEPAKAPENKPEEEKKPDAVPATKNGKAKLKSVPKPADKPAVDKPAEK
jgi:hypothetical protein